MAPHPLANQRAGRPSPGPPQPASSSRRQGATPSLDGAGGDGSRSRSSRPRASASAETYPYPPLGGPSGVPLPTLLRLGALTPARALGLPSPSASASTGSSQPAGSSGELSLEELETLHEALVRAKDAAETRARDVARCRDRLVASAAHARSLHPQDRATLSPAPSAGREKIAAAASSTASSGAATPLNASTISVSNANTPAPSSTRGVKRSRTHDSASDSSLSPQSATSISSFEPTNSQNAPRPSSSRHASPALVSSAAASGMGLGLSSAKLSRSAAQSREGKEASVPPASGTPSLSSSALASSVKDAKALAIPGMGAPTPALPGFTKKKKQPQPDKHETSRASSASASRQYSPFPEQNRTASTSRLPPPPSSLPPRPASLPAKPITSYPGASSSSLTSHRREVSGTGSTSSKVGEGSDRERQYRERDKERDRNTNSNSINDRDNQQRVRDIDRRELSSSKGKESERDSNSTSNESTQDQENVEVSQSSTTSVTNTPNSEYLGVEPEGQRPPEPSPRPPEDEPPPPPPPLPPPSIEDDGMDLVATPVIAIEDATPTPEPDRQPRAPSSTNTSQPKANSPGVTAGPPTDAPTSEKSSSHVQQSKPRKTLPPSATFVAASTASQAQATSPKAATVPPSAIPPNLTGTASSRPNTPLGRKKLPASVTAAASRRASPAPTNAKDSAGLIHSTATDVRSSLNQTQPVQEGGKTSAGDGESLAAIEAKQRRREEKRKRKLAALTANGGHTTSSPSAAMNGVNGSPAIKINGVTHASGRLDSMPPSKMRRVDSATSIDSNEKGGLKVKLNGIMLNRPKSATPADANQPPIKKGPSIPGIADDFTPPTRPLVPAPPEIHLPAPTPSKQSEINENFDNAKPSTQVPYTTFANWVNDFFRSFGEDDLAFLAPKPEELGVYDVPPLGPHYQDTWAAMDAELNGEQVEAPPPSTALVPPALRRFKSQNLTTVALTTENMYLGPLGERLISAFKDTKDIRGIMEDLLRVQDDVQGDKGNADIATVLGPTNSAPGIAVRPSQHVMEAGYDTQTSPHLNGPAIFSDPKLLAATPSIKEMDALDFESRLTRELSFLGIIPLPTRVVPPANTAKPSKKTAESTATQFDLSSSVDWSSRADDEISTALRACQRQLKKQVALNDKRKERLASIVRQRIAYQEYEHLRDGLEAVIEGAWAKRQRAAQRKAQKDRKEKDKKGEREKDRDKLEAASLAQSIAALNTPQPLSASLVAALTKRRNLVDSVQPLFPPNAYILPTESIYEGLAMEADKRL